MIIFNPHQTNIINQFYDIATATDKSISNVIGELSNLQENIKNKEITQDESIDYITEIIQILSFVDINKQKSERALVELNNFSKTLVTLLPNNTADIVYKTISDTTGVLSHINIAKHISGDEYCDDNLLSQDEINKLFNIQGE